MWALAACAWLAAYLGASACARAQTPTPTAAAATGAADRAAPRPTSARYLDANADRVLLSPTAETHPQDTLFVSTYYVLPQLGYAITNRSQVAVAGIAGTDGGFLDLSLKSNLLRQRHLRVSATAAFNYAGGGDLNVAFGRARSTAQWCFTADCRSSLSASGMLILHAFPGVAMPYGLAAGLTAHVSDTVTLLLDYASVLNASRDLFFLDFPFLFVSYGVRVSASPRWSLDLALLRALGSSTPTVATERPLLDAIGLPFFAFTYRLGPRL